MVFLGFQAGFGQFLDVVGPPCKTALVSGHSLSKIKGHTRDCVLKTLLGQFCVCIDLAHFNHWLSLKCLTGTRSVRFNVWGCGALFSLRVSRTLVQNQAGF